MDLLSAFPELEVLFDLDREIDGVSLRQLVEAAPIELGSDDLVGLGTLGPSDRVVELSAGLANFYYVPHLFPEMDPKLRLAHELQFKLLPRSLPSGARVEVSAVLESYCHLSGDVFGWELGPGGDFLFWILDISGHGVNAGLTATVIKLVLDRLERTPDLTHLVSRLNRAVLEVKRSGDAAYATGVFAMLAEDGSLSYCSAGHPDTLIVGSRGPVHGLASNSLPIGLFSDAEYVTEQARLAPGDLLLAATDGLLEATDRQGESYGNKRLRSVLAADLGSPAQLTQAIYKDLASHQDMSKLDDDITFVALRPMPPGTQP